MIKINKQEFKRFLFTRKNIMVVIGIVAIAIRGMHEFGVFSYKQSYIHVYAITFAASGIMYLISFLAVIPYSTIYCDEYNSGYINLIYSKIGFRKYFKLRIISVTLSGAIALGIALVTIFFVIFIVGKPSTSSDAYSLNNTLWYDIFLLGGDYLYFLLKLLLGMIYGAVWALAGFAISTWITNKYVVIIAPFAITQILWISLIDYPYFNPIFMFRGDIGTSKTYLESYIYLLFFQLVLYILFFGLSYIGLKRRYENE